MTLMPYFSRLASRRLPALGAGRLTFPVVRHLTRCGAGLTLVMAPLLAPSRLAAQVRVHPTGVNVNAQGATTAFLTFGGLRSQVAVEAFWCGELVSAAPGRGFRCDPGTIFGRLPIRYDLSSASGAALTDIMSIPASVARRAYQEAERGS